MIFRKSDTVQPHSIRATAVLPDVSKVVKVLDEDVLGELFVLDDQSGLAHHEVTEHFLILEPLTLRQSHVGPPETFSTHHDFLGIRTAKGEGRLFIRNPLLGKEVESPGTNPV